MKKMFLVACVAFAWAQIFCAAQKNETQKSEAQASENSSASARQIAWYVQAMHCSQTEQYRDSIAAAFHAVNDTSDKRVQYGAGLRLCALIEAFVSTDVKAALEVVVALLQNPAVMQVHRLIRECFVSMFHVYSSEEGAGKIIEGVIHSMTDVQWSQQLAYDAGTVLFEQGMGGLDARQRISDYGASAASSDAEVRQGAWNELAHIHYYHRNLGYALECYIRAAGESADAGIQASAQENLFGIIDYLLSSDRREEGMQWLQRAAGGKHEGIQKQAQERLAALEFCAKLA